MIERTQIGGVSALWATWPRSRVMGYGVHVFVVRGVMIDTGFPGVASDMREAIASFRPRGAMLTHHHEDHAGNLQQFVDAGLPVAMDADTLARVRQPGRIGLYRHFTWKPMGPLKGDVTPFGDETLALVPTPGHCSNHHSVWDADTGTCFTGDYSPRNLVTAIRDTRPNDSETDATAVPNLIAKPSAPRGHQ